MNEKKKVNYDQGIEWRSCIGCGASKFVAVGMPFCQNCWSLYKDRLHEPWVRGIRNLNQVQERSWKKYRLSTVSIEAMEEMAEERLGNE